MMISGLASFSLSTRGDKSVDRAEYCSLAIGSTPFCLRRSTRNLSIQCPNAPSSYLIAIRSLSLGTPRLGPSRSTEKSARASAHSDPGGTVRNVYLYPRVVISSAADPGSQKMVFFRSKIWLAAIARPLEFVPNTILTPESASRSASDLASAGVPASAFVQTTGAPLIPPCSLMISDAISAPRKVSCPRNAVGPLKLNSAPIFHSFGGSAKTGAMATTALTTPTVSPRNVRLLTFMLIPVSGAHQGTHVAQHDQKAVRRSCRLARRGRFESQFLCPRDLERAECAARRARRVCRRDGARR